MPTSRVPDAEDLSGLIAAYRAHRGLTQAALAERVGVSREYVSRVETGPPSLQLQRLFALLSALDLELCVRDEDAP